MVRCNPRSSNGSVENKSMFLGSCAFWALGTFRHFQQFSENRIRQIQALSGIFRIMLLHDLPWVVAHDCGYPLSRYTCRATRVAADFLDFRAFCRCSSGVAPHPLKTLVSHLSPPPIPGRCRTEIWVWKGVALHGGVAATVAGVALHCATKLPWFHMILHDLREQINGDLKKVIWDCSLQSDSGHPSSSPLSKNSRNTVFKLRFANVLGRINGDLKRVIWDCSLQSDSEHPIFSPLSENSRNTVFKLRFASLRDLRGAQEPRNVSTDGKISITEGKRNRYPKNIFGLTYKAYFSFSGCFK